VLVLVGLAGVGFGGEIGVLVVVRAVIVGTMLMVVRRRITCVLVSMAVGVLVAVRVLMAVRMTVNEVTVAMLVLVDMLVRVLVDVLVLVVTLHRSPRLRGL
jgi:hypothetical protein